MRAAVIFAITVLISGCGPESTTTTGKGEPQIKPAAKKADEPKKKDVRAKQLTPKEPKKKDEKIADATETPKSLLEKGRGQYHAGDFVLARDTWLQAIGLCRAEKEEQLLKGELYLRVGQAIDVIDGNPDSTSNRPKTQTYRDKFYQLYREQEVDIKQALQRHFEIRIDQDSLFADAFRKSK